MLLAAPPLTRPERTYEIHEVAELTGLAAARLRAWERRYEVVRPRRMSNGYRAYTADQVALLRAFARLIDGGERIGDLAARPREEVLAQADARRSTARPRPHCWRRCARSTASGSRGWWRSSSRSAGCGRSPPTSCCRWRSRSAISGRSARFRSPPSTWPARSWCTPSRAGSGCRAARVRSWSALACRASGTSGGSSPRSP